MMKSKSGNPLPNKEERDFGSKEDRIDAMKESAKEAIGEQRKIMTTPLSWKERFDLIGGEKILEGFEELPIGITEEMLLTRKQRYKETMFELDPEKVKSFIASLLAEREGEKSRSVMKAELRGKGRNKKWFNLGREEERKELREKIETLNTYTQIRKDITSYPHLQDLIDLVPKKDILSLLTPNKETKFWTKGGLTNDEEEERQDLPETA